MSDYLVRATSGCQRLLGGLYNNRSSSFQPSCIRVGWRLAFHSNSPGASSFAELPREDKMGRGLHAESAGKGNKSIQEKTD